MLREAFRPGWCEALMCLRAGCGPSPIGPVGNIQSFPRDSPSHRWRTMFQLFVKQSLCQRRTSSESHHSLINKQHNILYENNLHK
ncbi:MAG: hypothetical protein KatS3mg113_0360 [Planctomycetaceae bacterium]|nr:MAG: hypothetical protein KatS3mg113_0360 [Planctomycetaceae bacterium]